MHQKQKTENRNRRQRRHVCQEIGGKSVFKEGEERASDGQQTTSFLGKSIISVFRHPDEERTTNGLCAHQRKPIGRSDRHIHSFLLLPSSSPSNPFFFQNALFAATRRLSPCPSSLSIRHTLPQGRLLVRPCWPEKPLPSLVQPLFGVSLDLLEIDVSILLSARLVKAGPRILNYQLANSSTASKASAASAASTVPNSLIVPSEPGLASSHAPTLTLYHSPSILL